MKCERFIGHNVDLSRKKSAGQLSITSDNISCGMSQMYQLNKTSNDHNNYSIRPNRKTFKEKAEVIMNQIAIFPCVVKRHIIIEKLTVINFNIMLILTVTQIRK